MIDRLDSSYFRIRDRLIEKLEPNSQIYLDHIFSIDQSTICHSIRYLCAHPYTENNFAETNKNSAYFNFLVKEQLHLRIADLKKYFQVTSKFKITNPKEGQIYKIMELNPTIVLSGVDIFLEDLIQFYQASRFFEHKA